MQGIKCRIFRNFFAGTLLLACLSCKKSVPASPPVLPPVVSIAVTVNIQNTVRVLNGLECGINLNYLMDDAVLAGQTLANLSSAINSMGVKFLRYPGGEKSDNYLFGKPPYSSAAVQAAYCNFPATDPRFFNGDLSAKGVLLDFDEYIQVCRQTGATPFLVIAYDAMYSTSTCGTKPTRAQLLSNAKEWVRYANLTKNYGVKYWMIGNESWNNSDYNGKVTPAVYAADIAAFADTMRSIDPSIKIIANGKSDWWQTVLQSSAASKIDYLSASNYLPEGFTGYDYYRRFTGDLNTEITAAVAAINNFAAFADKSRIEIIMSEYNSIEYYGRGWQNKNDLGHALANFQMLGDALLQPKLFSACLWNTRWITNAEQKDNLFDAVNATGGLNAIGKALGIVGKNLLNTMVVTTSDNQLVKPYTTYDSTSAVMNIFLINKDRITQAVKINIANYAKTSASVWVLKGTGEADVNPSWTQLSNVTATNNTVTLNLDATSVTMIKFN